MNEQPVICDLCQEALSPDGLQYNQSDLLTGKNRLTFCSSEHRDLYNDEHFKLVGAKRT